MENMVRRALFSQLARARKDYTNTMTILVYIVDLVFVHFRMCFASAHISFGDMGGGGSGVL